MGGDENVGGVAEMGLEQRDGAVGVALDGGLGEVPVLFVDVSTTGAQGPRCEQEVPVALGELVEPVAKVEEIGALAGRHQLGMEALVGRSERRTPLWRAVMAGDPRQHVLRAQHAGFPGNISAGDGVPQRKTFDVLPTPGDVGEVGAGDGGHAEAALVLHRDQSFGSESGSGFSERTAADTKAPSEGDELELLARSDGTADDFCAQAVGEQRGFGRFGGGLGHVRSITPRLGTGNILIISCGNVDIL